MKKTFKLIHLFSLFLTIHLYIASPIVKNDICFGEQESNLISIISPLAVSTNDHEQIVEGKVEETFIKRVRVTVEPFLPKKGEQSKSIVIETINGYFKQKIDLFPGLNIISISTLSGKHKKNKPIFLIAQKKEDEIKIPLDKWGTNSPIVFTAPQAFKSSTPDTIIGGVVTAPDIKSIKIIVINTMDFLTDESLSKEDKKDRIDYREVLIKDLQFNFPVKLTEGLNIIIARTDLPSGKIDPTNIQLKTLIYEKVSNKIILNDPYVKDGILIIEGKVTDRSIKKVQISVSALIKEEIHPRITPKTLINKSTKVTANGDFILKFAFDKKGLYTIKSPPTISVWSNGNSATKTLLSW